MEKRRQNTRTRTLAIGTACSQFVLIAALFAPALVGFHQRAADEKPLPAEVALTAPPAEQTHLPDQLDKIFSIVKLHRPDISDAEGWRISEVILEESEKRKLDPMMVVALICVESGFQYTTVSPMGARGIMQIMPDTGKFLTETLSDEYGFHPARFRPESLDDPLLSIRLGVYYLHDLAKQFRNMRLALLAYNAGPGEIQNRLANNVDFPHDYATLVLDMYHRYKTAPPPPF